MIPKSSTLDLLGGSAALAESDASADSSALMAAADSDDLASDPREDNDVSDDRPALPGDPAPLQFSAALALAGHLKVPVRRIQSLMRLSDRKWQRRRQKGVFDIDESDRLYRIARVLRGAISVLGSNDKARSWLSRPNRMLGLVAPIDLMSSDPGAAMVTDEINRIEHGDLF
jgi:putative toxin-antitoxin system antitoxin component (TIGR02293 family)